MNFERLQLIPALLRALHEKGYDAPTPIQVQAIPPVLAGSDVLGIAQTGTGKTAAFALPILQRLAAHPVARGGRHEVRALVLCPTRELAAQIGASFNAYGKHLGLRSGVVFGGVGIGPQKALLARGVDVLVATPGRLLDLLGQRAVRFNDLEVLVLDEADRMLDLGFLPDVKRVLEVLPRKRQTLCFSATLPEEIKALVARLLHEPVRVAVAPSATTAEKVEQKLFHVARDQKNSFLAHLLSDPAVTRALVFTRTKRGADRVVKSLSQHGITAQAIHGNKSQNARERALSSFKSGAGSVLVATDIAARGIDVPGISHVINFDMPVDPESYVHRIGRTARASATGQAWSLCSGEEKELLKRIEKITRQRIPSEAACGGKTFARDSEGPSHRPAHGAAHRPAHAATPGRAHLGRVASGSSDRPATRGPSVRPGHAGGPRRSHAGAGSHAPRGSHSGPARHGGGHGPARGGHGPVRTSHGPVRTGHGPARTSHGPGRASPSSSSHGERRSHAHPPRASAPKHAPRHSDGPAHRSRGFGGGL